MESSKLNKTILTVVIVAVIVLVVWVGYTKYYKTKENYIDVPMTAQVTRVAVAPNGRTTLMPNSGPVATQFVSVPSYQSMLSPRFMADSYGTNIKYSPPKYANTGVPLNPLGYGNIVNSRENFVGNDEGCTQCNGNCGSTCSRTGMDTSGLSRTGIKSGNIIDSNSNPSFSSEIIDSVPVGTMDEPGAEGAPVQSIVYDRMVYSTSKDKYYKQGADTFRGDLAIAPNPSTPKSRWFQTTGNPTSSLVTGYMQSLAGASDNSAMADLLLKYKGNASLIGGGESTLSTLGLGGDIVVTSFP